MSDLREGHRLAAKQAAIEALIKSGNGVLVVISIGELPVEMADGLHSDEEGVRLGWLGVPVVIADAAQRQALLSAGVTCALVDRKRSGLGVGYPPGRYPTIRNAGRRELPPIGHIVR